MSLTLPESILPKSIRRAHSERATSPSLLRSRCRSYSEGRSISRDRVPRTIPLSLALSSRNRGNSSLICSCSAGTTRRSEWNCGQGMPQSSQPQGALATQGLGAVCVAETRLFRRPRRFVLRDIKTAKWPSGQSARTKVCLETDRGDGAWTAHSIARIVTRSIKLSEPRTKTCAQIHSLRKEGRIHRWRRPKLTPSSRVS